MFADHEETTRKRPNVHSITVAKLIQIKRLTISARERLSACPDDDALQATVLDLELICALAEEAIQ